MICRGFSETQFAVSGVDAATTAALRKSSRQRDIFVKTSGLPVGWAVPSQRGLVRSGGASVGYVTCVRRRRRRRRRWRGGAGGRGRAQYCTPHRARLVESFGRPFGVDTGEAAFTPKKKNIATRPLRAGGKREEEFKLPLISDVSRGRTILPAALCRSTRDAPRKREGSVAADVITDVGRERRANSFSVYVALTNIPVGELLTAGGRILFCRLTRGRVRPRPPRVP